MGVQEGEGLIRISDLFGVTRDRVISANEGIRERNPIVEPGDLIIVPLGLGMTTDELEALPGYRGFVGDDG